MTLDNRIFVQEEPQLVQRLWPVVGKSNDLYSKQTFAQGKVYFPKSLVVESNKLRFSLLHCRHK
jgi:hypothetical protein